MTDADLSVIGNQWTYGVDGDASTFLDSDIPALLERYFAPSDSSRITCPVLHVAGTESGPWDVAIEADHALAVTQSRQIARALVAFLGRHDR